MSESFGARLRRRREEQQIALGAIAEQTKIKQSLLEGLERDDLAHWPTGIFRRAFIRAYGHAIGLDPDVVVREFFDVFPEPVEAVTTTALAAAADAARGTGAPNRFRSLLGSFSRLRRSAPAAERHDDAVPATAAEPPCVDVPDMIVDDAAVRPGVESAAPEGRSLPALAEPDFTAIAQVCTQFARVDNPSDVRPLLRQAALILNATGVVVWVWDQAMTELRPALSAGYSDAVLAHLPNVRPDADNVTALAFRSGQAHSLDSVDRVSALAVPLVTPGGCAGVLAFELQRGAPTGPVRAAATIVAAQLSQLIGGAQPAEVPVPALAVACASA
jgi:transcriptional regulator with XRE-family HTH domain